jgi:hypothetical protein
MTSTPETELLAAIRRYYVEEATMLTPAEIRNHVREAVDHYAFKKYGVSYPLEQPPIDTGWVGRFRSMKQIDKGKGGI